MSNNASQQSQGAEKHKLRDAADETESKRVCQHDQSEVASSDEEACSAPDYRRVIAVLPRLGAHDGMKANAGHSSDDEDDDYDDCVDGCLDDSSSSSGFDEGIPFPTKPRIIIKRGNDDSNSER